jgi:membrane-associated phospholipid phosphatase
MVARHRKVLLSIAVLCLALAAACFVLVKLTGPLPGELRFEEWRLGDGYPSVLHRPMTFVTYFGDTWVAVGCALVLAAVTAEEVGPRWAVLVLVAAASAVVAELLSEILGPTAPEYAGAAGVNLGPENNFPSGHTAYVTSVYGVTSWLALERGHRMLAAALALPVLLIGPALALQGNHYPADVVGGYGIGCAWVIAVLLVGEAWTARERKRLSAP